MHRLIAATALCAVALGATAASAASPMVAGPARPAAIAIQATAMPAIARETGRPVGSAMVKTAGPATASNTAADGTGAGQEPDRSRHTGPAMLFAALALMLGVALRRLGAGPR